jgi:hypothetical protein
MFTCSLNCLESYYVYEYETEYPRVYSNCIRARRSKFDFSKDRNLKGGGTNPVAL